MKKNRTVLNDSEQHSRAEEALLQSEQRMRLHIEQTPLAVIEWDTDFQVLQWNPAAEKIFGYTAPEAIGQHAGFIIPAESREHVDQTWKALLEQKGGCRSTNDNITKDGRIICCAWYNTPLSNAEGEVIGVASLAQDITEQKQEQQELQLFKESVENASDAIGMSTPEGVHYYQNRAFDDLFGHIGPDPSANLYVDEQVGREVFKTIMSGGQWSGEVEMYAKDEKVLKILLRAYANKDSNGRIIGLVGIHTDITRRKKDDEELRESKNLLNEIQDLAHTCGWKYDFKTGEITWSDGLYRLLGYEPGSVEPSFEQYGKHIHPNDQDFIGAIHASPAPLSKNIKYGMVSTDGSTHYLLTRNRYEYGGGDTPRYLYGAIVDITERERAENELKASRDMLEKIFQTSPDCIFFTDDTGCIAAVNDAALAALGYAEQELIGQSMDIFSAERNEDRAPSMKMLDIFFEKGLVKDYEIIWRKKNGSNIYLECNALSLLDESGKMTGAVSVLRDISDRKKIEAQLRQSQKMEAIGTLAGGIAHDFNNILAAIMGYTELSLDEISRGLSVEYNLEQILKSTLRARDLIRQILAFSRKDIEELAPLQVSTIIKEALQLLKATLPSTIEIQENISGQPGLVNANPTQIHQILMNLCTNAAHAMSENGGVLGIGVQPVFVDAPHMPENAGLGCGAYVKITVSDTGTGIAPQNMDRIFEPFFTTKEIGKGTGMGLAVVHGIVKSHGGDILVESEPGRGSTFEVLLPQIPESPLGGSSQTGRLFKGTERILLVDDEEILLELGQNMLKSLGYAPTVAHSSTGALELFKKDPLGFDLVITDMTMPQMTGDVLAKQLMAIRPGIPVIIATGFSEKISEETALELGIRALLMKPINRLELAQTIRTVLDSKTV